MKKFAFSFLGHTDFGCGIILGQAGLMYHLLAGCMVLNLILSCHFTQNNVCTHMALSKKELHQLCLADLLASVPGPW